jgi:hypothetical protein
MPETFKSTSQRQTYDAVVGELRRLGYAGDLLVEDYGFADWFAAGTPERRIPAAAFGQTPPSSDTACLAVLLSNGEHGHGLVKKSRALGAPFALEVDERSVSYWLVGHTDEKTRLVEQFNLGDVDAAFKKHADDWRPESVLRAKNIASKPTPRQLELFDYELLPELEHRIRDTLDPMVRNACSAAVNVYQQSTGRQPDERRMFRLAFWLLAGKVFCDRQIRGFVSLKNTSSADEVLKRVARHYREPLPVLLNQAARAEVFNVIWSGFDFRNLSIDVLTQMWTTTFVSNEVRKRLGIHATPRTIAKYIVDNLPFEDICPQDRIVLEPCCGSATFLTAALQRLRDELGQEIAPRDRHQYLKDHLVGFEKEAFGIEISRLCLTLADFPEPNGWQLNERDVFASSHFKQRLSQSRIVLCNPPFEDFAPTDRTKYGVSSVKKPVELLDIILSHIHPDGIIGFVLPRLIVDGVGYKATREKLASRYKEIDVVTLPDSAFETADQETAILLAHAPRHNEPADNVRVSYSQVAESGWYDFKTYHDTTSQTDGLKTIADAKLRLAIQGLSAVWTGTEHLQRLGDVATIRRGLEWENMPLQIRGAETGNRDVLVKQQPPARSAEYHLGLPPRAKPFHSFQSPPPKYLRMRKEDERGNSYGKPWEEPKVIMNKATRSRGRWRIAAFSDLDGLVFYQTLTGIWPDDPGITTAVAAVLNGPMANAFVSTTEGKIDIRSSTLANIPIPEFQPADIEALDSLVEKYAQAMLEKPFDTPPDVMLADTLIRRIDAIVLAAYDLSPKRERELLDYFNVDAKRIVPYPFAQYFPSDFEPYYSLKDYLHGDFSQKSAREIQSRFTPPSDDVIEALAVAAGDDDQ